MKTKKCSCGVFKYSTEFYKKSSSTDGLSSKCKSCCLSDKKKYYQDNKQKIKTRVQKYRERNKEKIKSQRKIYYENNRLEIIKKNKINASEKQYHKGYYSKRVADDKIFKLKDNIKCLIRYSLRQTGFNKNTKTADILGCSFLEFKNYLEDNPYGFCINQKGLDIDHIIPLSNAKNKQDVTNLNHYSNFQLLPREYNRNIKRNKNWDREHFEEWYYNLKN